MREENKHEAINDLDKPLLKEVSYDSNKAVSFFADIKAEEFAKNILSLDPNIRFAGLIERSGYLFAGGIREGVSQRLKTNKAELSLSQSAHIVYLGERFLTELGNLNYILYNYDKVKLFNMPVKEHILAFSTESTASTEEVASKVSQYIKSMEHQLSLHPPSNIINKEKKETLRNLYESGFEEEVIADQLDLDLTTVRMLIKELYF
jgi:uncharacterized protein DUF6659